MGNNNEKIRLDQLLVERGLADTRSKALGIIMAGLVKAGGRLVTKAGERISINEVIDIIKPPHPYVSRGGLKLEKAISFFSIDAKDRICIDAGASTGGFTHCLLLNGAAKVYAVDVGYGQIDLSLRNDPRVIVIEKCNVRYLSPGQVPEKADIITADLSFISLEKVLTPLYSFLKPGGEMITLIKPQFEAEISEIKKGVVRDEKIRERVVKKIQDYAESIGLKPAGVVESPITGPKGNVEFLGYFQKEKTE